MFPSAKEAREMLIEIQRKKREQKILNAIDKGFGCVEFLNPSNDDIKFCESLEEKGYRIFKHIGHNNCKTYFVNW